MEFDFEDETAISKIIIIEGKAVFVNFWASWCPPCRAKSSFKNNPGIFFLMINEDYDPAMAKAYLEKENFSVPLYKIKNNIPAAIYTGTLPTTMVLDKNGKIRFRQVGFANYGSEKFINKRKNL